MNNNWNQKIYKVWSPVYDLFFNSGNFKRARQSLFKGLSLNKGEKILFVGVGTGLELELVKNAGVIVTAIDLSPDMLNKAKKKYGQYNINFIEMDAQNLKFDENEFDLVVGSLVLSVVPDAHRCFEEMIRVLKPNGKLVIFDKFAPKNGQLPLVKRLLRPLISALGTDIGVSFEKLVTLHLRHLKIINDEPAMLNGMYRKIVIIKE